ncbi:MAG: hypothetical protein M1827_001022 [Pycnora praestabilis]|nr:MAG: hypothetical protein M1827_001022 [Pycnora praestabilis]
MASALAPISKASAIVGFLSFAFTLGTFLNVFWNAFMTVGGAPVQVRDHLSNMRQVLYEERDHLRKCRRRWNDCEEVVAAKGDMSKVDDRILVQVGTLRVLSDTVRDLIRQFKKLERPFLADPNLFQGDERGPAIQPRYKCDLWHRILWWRHKGSVNELAINLERLQMRRVAREVTEGNDGSEYGEGLEVDGRSALDDGAAASFPWIGWHAAEVESAQE